MAEPKKMKSSVRFRRGAMTRECGVCEHWQRPKSCARVVGEVSAGDVCALFERAKVKGKAT